MYPTNRCLRTVSWKEESFACAHYARYASASDKHVAWIPESLILLWDKSSSVTSFCFAQIQISKKRIYKLIEMVPAFDVFSSRLISWLSFSFSMTSVRSSSVALFSWPIQGDCTVGRMSIDLQDILHQSAAQFDLRSKFIIFGFMSDQQRARRARNWSALMWLLCNSSWWARISRLESFFPLGIPSSLVRSVSLRLGRKQAYVQSWGQGFMPPVAIPHHVLVNVLGGRSAEILISVPWCGEVDTHWNTWKSWINRNNRANCEFLWMHTGASPTCGWRSPFLPACSQVNCTGSPPVEVCWSVDFLRLNHPQEWEWQRDLQRTSP